MATYCRHCLTQVVVTAQEQVASSQEGRRMKKHLVKLQQQAQGLAVMQPSVAQTQQDQRRLQVALQQVRLHLVLLHLALAAVLCSSLCQHTLCLCKGQELH